eukprot:9630359-Ditylum_brightwellii.AAC.1
MITDDGIESHGNDSNVGSDFDPQDEEDKTFDMEKKKSVPTASEMIQPMEKQDPSVTSSWPQYGPDPDF